MVNPERFFEGRQLAEIPSEKNNYIIWEPPFDGYETEFKISGEESVLVNSDIADFFPKLFDDDKIPADTLQALGINKSSGLLIETLNELQSGQRGIIRIVRVSDGYSSPCYFAVHISRFPVDDERSNYLPREWSNLKGLSGLFREHLDQSILERFNVVRPFGWNISGDFQGNRYPYFTMPLVPLGELHQTFENVGNNFVPYFIYALPYTDRMWWTNQNQNIKAITDQGIELHQNLSRDIVLFNGLVYYLTKGRMIDALEINNGDLMTEINDYGLDLTLVSLPGGFTDLMTEDEFVAKIRNRQEHCRFRVPETMGEVLLRTFPKETDDEFFYDALEEARNLVDGKRSI